MTLVCGIAVDRIVAIPPHTLWMGGQRQLCTDVPLPLARMWLCGPKWRRGFEVEAQKRSFRKSRLVVSFEADIRERICEELRPGVVAQWSDPYERFGLRRSA